MKKLLFVSGFGIDSMKPNPICEKYILDELRKDPNLSVDVVCNGTVEKTPLKDWRTHPLFMLRRIFMWPVINPDAAINCLLELKEKIGNGHCNSIFVCHKPYEVIWAVQKIKRMYPQIKLLFYELDPIANEIDANNGIGKALFFLTRLAERRMYRKCDVIFHMNCNKEKYGSAQYQKYHKKSVYLDFPLISYNDKIKNQTSCHEKSEKITLLYAGALDDVYRSPDYLLHLFDEVSKTIPLQISFFAQGNSITKIERMAKQNSAFHLYDYVSQDELQKYIEQTDFLINIGNKYSTMLPSKLLSYIKTGKPIVHCQKQQKDACLAYLERYEMCNVINEKTDFEENVEKLREFLVEYKGKRKTLREVADLFKENTPAWSVEQITKYI